MFKACYRAVGIACLDTVLFLTASCAAIPAATPPPPTTSPIPASPIPATPIPATPIPASPIPNTPIPDSPVPAISLCSPLAVQPRETLGEIISQPFIAPGPLHDADHPERVLRDDGHHGLDLGYYTRDGKPFTGTPVLAALAGRVAAVVQDRPPYGNMVMIETGFERIPPALAGSQQITPGDSLYTLYAHLQNLRPLAAGDAVTCGQQLAETGLTGFSGGPHLHFETRWGPPGERFASMAYYRADADAREMAAYEKWRMSAVFHLFDPLELLGLP